MPILMGLFGPVSGAMVGRFGPRPSLIIGGSGIVLSGLLGALPTATPVGVRLYLVYGLLGLGLGWINAAIIDTAMAGMPSHQAAVAAGLVSTQRQLGQAIGVAVVGSIIAGRVTRLVPGPGFTEAFRTSWGILGGCGLVVLALGVVTTGTWARCTATRNEERMFAEVRRAPLDA